MSSLHLTRKAIWMSCHQLPAFTMFVVKTVILSIKLLWKHRVFRANTHSYTNKSHFAPKIVRFFVACLNEISWKLRENVTSILLSQSNDLRCSISILAGAMTITSQKCDAKHGKWHRCTVHKKWVNMILIWAKMKRKKTKQTKWQLNGYNLYCKRMPNDDLALHILWVFYIEFLFSMLNLSINYRWCQYFASISTEFRTKMAN